MINNVTIWLDRTAKRYPNKVAFSDENSEITFSQLRNKALSVAHFLTDQGITKSAIAIMIEKSVDTVVAMLGVAYSGNFYTILDIDMPTVRKKKIIEIFNPTMVITKRENEIDFSIEEEKVLNIEDTIEQEYDSFDEVYAIREKCIDTDLLYVLFTSGSTGIPKGVTICHRSVVDYIDWVENTFEITEKDAFGNQAPFYFDNSVLDIYTAIKTGAEVVIIPKILFSQPVKLLEYILIKNINTIFWVPLALMIVANLRALKIVDLSKQLKRILFAGEVMPNKQLNIWRKHIPNALYANLYGPTEIAVDCTYYIVNREFADDESLPIGYPCRNTDIIVLNDDNKLVHNNEKGELCVRGTSLSLGYYNNVEKTKEVFVQNPLNSAYIDLIYRTGDIVHYNEYGEIMYDSRKDFQIKHKGHRIELGEIENAAYGCGNIEHCCCIYDSKRSHIVLVYSGDTDKEEVLRILKNSIPEYMIPSKIIKFEKLPINQNGKIDRKIVMESI